MPLQHLDPAGTLRMNCSASSKSLFVNSTVATPKSLGIECSAVEEGRWNRHSFHHASTRSNSIHVEQTTRRRSLVNSPETPNPSQGHEWTISEDDSLVINWMTGSPAPQVVLSLLSCTFARVVGRTIARASLMV